MAANEIRVGDVGTVLKCTLKDDGVVVDLSGTSAKKFLFKRPNSKTFEVNAAFVSDGTDGQLKYTTQTGDLNISGIWEWQARVTWATGDTWTTDVSTFEVYKNLR